MEKNAPQDFVAGIDYEGKYLLAENDELPVSARLLSGLLPPKAKIHIYTKVVFSISISNSAFKELKENHMTALSSNPRRGEIICQAENGKIKTSLNLGKTRDIIVLDKDTEQYLYDKMSILFSIESGLKLEQLPLRKIDINPVERTLGRNDINKKGR